MAWCSFNCINQISFPCLQVLWMQDADSVKNSANSVKIFHMIFFFSQKKLFLTLRTDEQKCNVRVSYSQGVTYWKKMKDLIGLENRKYCINQPTHCWWRLLAFSLVFILCQGGTDFNNYIFLPQLLLSHMEYKWV